MSSFVFMTYARSFIGKKKNMMGGSIKSIDELYTLFQKNG